MAANPAGDSRAASSCQSARANAASSSTVQLEQPSASAVSTQGAGTSPCSGRHGRSS